MTTLAEIEVAAGRLAPDEKLRLIESLWAGLRDAEVDSPAWHGEVLAETARRYEAGEETPLDWAEAKRQLRERSR